MSKKETGIVEVTIIFVQKNWKDGVPFVNTGVNERILGGIIWI